ncbi:cytochrome P450 [Schizopora paradoxa]|uniref:Cytochrome P450 n=1 Tax=Schizopora paradoxa TaxID=27342 RepID=A0A0H2S0R9_9AGAM|nr:cytochrome P450 [Schizopora paradoxa]
MPVQFLCFLTVIKVGCGDSDIRTQIFWSCSKHSKMLNILPTWIDCIVLMIVFSWLKLLQQRKSPNYPPGPKGYPLIGNMLEMMVSEMWEVARKWRSSYGEFIYLKSLNQTVFVINSYEIAVELLEKRSLNYSDRPSTITLSELQQWDWAFTMKPYGEEWRRLRAPLQKFFDPANLAQLDNVLEYEAEKLLHNLIRSPGDYEMHVRTAVASFIMTTIYGHEVTTSDDPSVNLAKEGVEQVSLALRPGEYLVDILPWLKYVPKWFPGAGFQVIAERAAKLSHDTRRLPFIEARDKIISGKSTSSSLTEQEIERCQKVGGLLSEEDEDRISSMSGVGYLAGGDTSFAAIMSLLLAMIAFPEVQKRAQAEIDEVVGTDRLPKLSDRMQLPYCMAMCKEVNRWNPVIPFGLAHLSKRDDTYNGYFIPAKSIMLPNQWAMLHDPEEYPEPSIFRPERFLPGIGERVQRDPAKVAFGFGRRICPGRFMAENTVFIMAVQILAVFDICKALNDKGEVIEPEVKFTHDGVARYPLPFECAIKPRSREAIELLREE